MSEEKRCPVCGHPMELFPKSGGKTTDPLFVYSCLCGHEEPVEEKDLPPDVYRKRYGET